MKHAPANPPLITPSAVDLRAAGGAFTVSQVTALVKQAIKSGLPSTIQVIGEISNFKRHSSGHLYYTLKDSASELSCVMWRSTAQKLKFLPTNGLQVVVTGGVEVFERAGRYQLYVRRMEPRGVGALELAFRQLCQKLEGEGLFDERHKKALPPYPTRIAVVTSPTGAALVDILHTIGRRYPCVHVLIYPVRVQGPGAETEIAHAIENLNRDDERLGGLDVMIVGRGGGSLEDLWAFNEEVVARAIFASRIPIISAVGHEVDVTIADLVADVRAATPTAAAGLAVPVMAEVTADLRAHEARMSRAMLGRCRLEEARLAGLLQRNVLREPLAIVHRREQLVDELAGRCEREVLQRVHGCRRKLDALEPTLQRIAPHRFLLKTSAAVDNMAHRLHWALARKLGDSEKTLADQVRRFEKASPERAIPRLTEQVLRLAAVLPTAMSYRISLLAEHIRGQEERLAAMGYKSVLNRGFSITRSRRGLRVVRSVRSVKDRDRMITELADGKFESEVLNLHQLELFG